MNVFFLRLKKNERKIKNDLLKNIIKFKEFL